MQTMKQWAIFFIISCVCAVCNYVGFGVYSSLGYAGKTDSVLFKVLGVVQQILWLPLGLLENTKFATILEWNYPAMMFVNSFIAVGIIYFIVFQFKKS